MTQIKAGGGLTLTVRGDLKLGRKEVPLNWGCAVRPAAHKLAAAGVGAYLFG